MTLISKKDQDNDPTTCAVYPVAEIKKLYDDQLKYIQAKQYIYELEHENKQLRNEIDILKHRISKFSV